MLIFKVVKAVRLDVTLGVHVIRKDVRTKTEPTSTLNAEDEEAGEVINENKRKRDDCGF